MGFDLGDPSSYGDLWNSVTGQSQQVPGLQYGASGAANDAGNLASSTGQGYAGTDAYQGQSAAAIGQANQAYMGNLGAYYGSGLQALGSQYGGQLAALGGHPLAQNSSTAGTAAAIGQNQQALAMLQASANGTGPSAAQAQLRAGLDQNIAAQQAQLASTRGGQLANAGLQASNVEAGLYQQTANQAAQLRAQEQQAAQAQYLAGTVGALGQANQAAQYQAQLNQGQQQFNQGFGLSALGAGANFNLGALGQAGQQQLGYNQAGMGNALGFGGLGAQYTLGGQGYGLQGLGLANNIQGTALGYAQGQQGIANANAAANAQGLQAVLSGAGDSLMALGA